MPRTRRQPHGLEAPSSPPASPPCPLLPGVFPQLTRGGVGPAAAGAGLPGRPLPRGGGWAAAAALPRDAHSASRVGAASEVRTTPQVINLPPRPRSSSSRSAQLQPLAVTTAGFCLYQTCHLRAAWETPGPSSDVRVLIFSSTPPSFCNRHDFFKILLNLQ